MGCLFAVSVASTGLACVKLAWWPSGIDTPEKQQAFGNISKQSLADMVAGQSVAFEWVKGDGYMRKVGKVVLGQNTNLELVTRGLVWHYKAYEREQPAVDRLAYADAQIEAKAANRLLKY